MKMFSSRKKVPVRLFTFLKWPTAALILLLGVSSTAYSQQTQPEDSVNANYQQQVNLQRLAVGQDTAVVLSTNEVDSIKIQPPQKTKGKRKFYWNANRYSLEDSSLNAKKLRRHSPVYAALFSMALPGLGQAYNKKYWKIPIVYAGLGGLGYACYYTASNFVGYRNAYRKQVAETPDLSASYKGVNDVATLKEYRDYFKRNLDISAICTGVWYILNIVDATVDAHLFEWNMKDDIHLSWQPVVITGNYNAASAPGLRIGLSF